MGNQQLQGGQVQPERWEGGSPGGRVLKGKEAGFLLQRLLRSCSGWASGLRTWCQQDCSGISF